MNEKELTEWLLKKFDEHGLSNTYFDGEKDTESTLDSAKEIAKEYLGREANLFTPLTRTFLVTNGFKREVRGEKSDFDGEEIVYHLGGIDLFDLTNNGGGFTYATYTRYPGRGFKSGFEIKTEQQLCKFYESLTGKKLPEDYVTNDNNNSNSGGDAPFRDINSVEQWEARAKEYKIWIEHLQMQLAIAKNALRDVEKWDGDLKDKWEDPGYRAIAALKSISEVTLPNK
jgi:hypothetical protein